MPLQSVSVSVSVLTLTAISMERYFAICHPLRLQSSISRPSRTRTVVIWIWIASGIVMAPEMFILDTMRHLPAHLDTDLLTTCKPVGWSYMYHTFYQFFLAVSLYIGPLGLISVAYFSIAHKLWLGFDPHRTTFSQTTTVRGK